MKTKLSLSIIALSFFSGCLNFQPTKDLSQFYVLRSIPELEQIQFSEAFTMSISKVTLPDYMERSQIVTAISKGQLYLSEENRWGEDIDKNLERVLLENFIKIIGSDHMLFCGMTKPKNCQELLINILEFIYDVEQKHVLLYSKWILTDQSKNILCDSTEKIIINVGSDYPAIVESMSQSLAQLCLRIARNLSSAQN